MHVGCSEKSRLVTVSVQTYVRLPLCRLVVVFVHLLMALLTMSSLWTAQPCLIVVLLKVF